MHIQYTYRETRRVKLRMRAKVKSSESSAEPKSLYNGLGCRKNHTCILDMCLGCRYVTFLNGRAGGYEISARVTWDKGITSDG